MSHNPLYSPYTKSFEQFSSLGRRRIKRRKSFEFKKEFKLPQRRQTSTSRQLQLSLFEEKHKLFQGTFENVREKCIQLSQSPKVIMAGLLMVAVLLGIAQLPYSHDLATKGYDLKRLEVAQKELMDKYERVNVQIAQAKSSEVLKASTTIEAMRRSYGIDYIEIPNLTVVASKE